MATAPKSKKGGASAGKPTPIDRIGVEVDDVLSDPSAGMVLHRVLAQAARTFLLNDMDEELVDAPGSLGAGTFDPVTIGLAERPVWAQSATISSRGAQRRTNEEERIHQSRVALRRIRPTCAPSAWPSIRPGGPTCGPSWPGTAVGWDGCGTSTSCVTS